MITGDYISFETAKLFGEVKSCLRRMSSMTEEERKEYLLCRDAYSQDMLNRVMTEQEKKLLFADLCARLPYGVM